MTREQMLQLLTGGADVKFMYALMSLMQIDPLGGFTKIWASRKNDFYIIDGYACSVML